MAKRRGHGEGTICQRPNGRWQGSIDLGRGLDGTRRRKTVYAATEAEVVRKMKRLNGRAVDGQLLTTSTPTVAVYLAEWFRTHHDEWRPSTRRGYQGAIDGYLGPAFGPLRLEQLTPLAVQSWLTAHKEQHGARRRITLAHATLRSALSAAQRLQLVAINAAALVTIPQPPKHPTVTLDRVHATTFLKATHEHRLAALFSVALACGLRLGEATGLRWDDVDLETGKVQIRQQLQAVKPHGAKQRLVLQALKTAKSRRTLALPQVCLDALRRHRTQQREERLKAGAAWVDTGLVFTTYAHSGGRGKVGSGLHPRNVVRILHGLLTAAGLPRMRFHDLRHSAASLLIAEGVELAEVSLLLGHSELRVTLDLYTHLQEQTAAKAARTMDAILTL